MLNACGCLWMNRPFLKKNPVDCLVWESSHFPECSCLLTEDAPSQDQCLCQRACEHLLFIQAFCSSWLWNPSTRGRFLLTILFAVIFVHFECTLTPPCPPIPTSRYNGIQKISVVHYGPLREIRWVTGKSNTAQAKEPATTAPPRHSERAFECASVFMITYWFFFLSCFLVKTNWTSHNDFFV